MKMCLVPTAGKTGKTKDGKTYAAEIYYSPGIWSPHGACHLKHATAGGGSGSKTDEVLFHELVHALRRSSGKRARVEISGGLVEYTSNEELYAILVSSIYCTDPSNKTGSGLRGGHGGFESLESELAGSFEFFRASTTVYSLVETFCNDNPGFTGALAKVKSTFNPLASYYSDKKKARENSQSSTAVVRDAKGWGKAIWEAVNPFSSRKRMTRWLLLLFALPVALAPLARAEQFVLFDVTFTYTKADADNSTPSKSHYYVKEPVLNTARPRNWTTPVD